MSKRWGEVARAMPLSLRVCTDLRSVYLRWLGDHVAQLVAFVNMNTATEGLNCFARCAAPHPYHN